MAVFSEPTKWAQTLGKDADVTTIPDTAGDTDPSIDKIFPAVFSIPLARGGKAIPRSVLNGLFKLLGDWSFYQQNGGIASYSVIFDYAIGRVVLYNGNLYKCIHTNGASSTVVTPDSNTAYWQRLDNFVRSVNSVNADDNGNVSITSVNHATSADNATTATNATNLGGYPATKYIRSVTGEIKWFAFNEAPDGYLVCNGANVSRTTYADLFNAIGTAFGSGDGSTTFTLPNLIDKFAQGSTTVGTVKGAGLPNITGQIFPIALDAQGSGGYILTCNTYGAFSQAYTEYHAFKVSTPEYVPNKNVGVDFNAAHSNSIYGNSSTVQPPALTLLPCIKY